MRLGLRLAAGVGVWGLATSSALAQAAEPATVAPSAGAAVAEVVVTGDRAGLLERRPNNTVFGLDKPLLETPRSASIASALTIERYGITSVDKLVEITPGSFTASYYGVPGALNVRGTLAENYFRGFKRVENRGTYATPIADAAQIEILRGPPTPIYGAGKVGGLLNFIPKSANVDGRYVTRPTGEITATYGSYNKKNITVQGGAPVNFGTVQGGLYGYLEIDDSHSYYRGIYPKRQTLQVSGDFDLGSGWTTSFGGMVYHSDGDVQTPGWNRLTQNLIDNQQYTTGRDTSLVDKDGNGRLTLNEISPNGANPYYYQAFKALYQIYPYCPYTSCVDPAHTLDVGVGTTKLDPRTVYISKADFSRTLTGTAYFDVAKRLSSTQSIKFQLFFDSLDNDRFVSYGFPASYQTYIGEGRLTYNFSLDALDGLIKSKDFIGASYRYVNAHKRESFNSGVIALDRRDIAFGATPTDIIDSPFSSDPPGALGLGWENDVHSNTRDAGLFFTSDVMIGPRLNLVVGARYDFYSLSSNDVGVLPYESTSASERKGKGTYTASLSYKLPFGLIPYITYDKAAALEIGQASDVAPALIANGGYLSNSNLAEAGLKFQLLHNTLVGSFGLYRQNRTQLNQGGGVTTIVGTRSKGAELEIRYLATKNLSFTFAGDMQRTTVKGPDRSFAYIPASVLGVSGVNGFGGTYVTFDYSTLPGRSGDYDYSLIPHSVVSLYGTYTSDLYSWGRAGGTIGVTHVTKTSGTIQNPVVYPDYALVNLSLFYARGPYELAFNLDNLTDKLYFVPDADSYANLGALPGIGREWRITLKRKF